MQCSAQWGSSGKNRGELFAAALFWMLQGSDSSFGGLNLLASYNNLITNQPAFNLPLPCAPLL